MSGSLLSWDDFEQETASPDIAKKAIESLANLDTTDAVAELRDQELAIAERKAIKEQKLTQVAQAPDLTIMQAATSASQAGLGMLNEGLRKRIELSLQNVPNIVGTGGRLKVSEKFLLNCTTDLNQLIPFKYGWSWIAYLTSCDKHWMPTEINWVNDEAKYKSLPANAKKLIMRNVVNYMYIKHVFPNDLLMSMYRHITNPECRQYILRFAFEECCLNHTMRHWEETFGLGSEVLPNEGLLKTSIMPDEQNFKDRHNFLKQYTRPLIDPLTSTEGVENTRAFLKNLIVFFGGIKYICQMGHWVQLIRMAKQFGLEGFLKNAEYVLRDMNRQLDFSKNFITTAIAENPDVFTQGFVDEIKGAFEQMVAFEGKFLRTLGSDIDDIPEGMSILNHLSNRYLNDIGILNNGSLPLRNGHWFIDYLDSKELAASAGNHEVNVTSTAGSGGLSFDD